MTYIASAAAALYGNVTLWTSRAGQAWGASGIWNNGPSYQSDLATANSQLTTLQGQYNSLQTSYNAMVADRDLWAARAAGVYVGGQWGVGETWQAAYNRVLPPASAQSVYGTVAGQAVAQWHDIGTCTTNRAGYWVAMGMLNLQPTGSNYDCLVRFQYGATIGVQAMIRVGTASTQAGWISGYDTTPLLTNGSVVRLQVNGNSNGTINGDMWIFFVPTQTYPH